MSEASSGTGLVWPVVLERFEQQAPAGVMARLALDHAFPASWVDQVFEAHRRKQYARELLLSTIVELMTLVCLGLRPSLHAAARQMTGLPVSLASLYDKVRHTEPAILRALVQGSADGLGAAVRRRDAGAGARSRTRADQERLFLDHCPRRPALGRHRSAGGGLQLRPRTRSGAHRPAARRAYRGIVQCDGYATYKALADPRRGEAGVTLVYCWSHARRGFYDLAKAGAAPIATEALARIAALYRIEAEIRGHDAGHRLDVRRACSRTLVADLRVWFETQAARLPARGPTAVAIRYALNIGTGSSGSSTTDASSLTPTASSARCGRW